MAPAAAAALPGVGLLTLAALVRGGGYGAILGVGLGTGAGLGATPAVRSAAPADRFAGPALGVVTGVYQWAFALGWTLCLRAALLAPPRPAERSAAFG